MSTVTATATRDGRWWIIALPVGGETKYTQARTLSEAQDMVDDLARIWADELGDRELASASIIIEVAGEASEMAAAVRAAQREAEEARERARRVQSEKIAAFRSQGMTMQDIATILGVTKARISQLTHA